MKIPSHRLVAASAALSCALLLSGCAGGIGLTLLGIGGGTAASAGVNHTLGGIAYKTFTAPPDDVHAAALSALASMKMPVEKDDTGENDSVRQVMAKASDRDVEIEIEEITPSTTRLRVVASQDILFKDSATATEIIMQTAQALDQLQTAKTRTAARKPTPTKTNVRARR